MFFEQITLTIYCDHPGCSSEMESALDLRTIRKEAWASRWALLRTTLMRRATRKGWARRGQSDDVWQCPEHRNEGVKEGTLSTLVRDIDWSIRVRNILLNEPESEMIHGQEATGNKLRMRTLRDLVEWGPCDLLELRNFGMGCLEEVRVKLARLGLRLAGDNFR